MQQAGANVLARFDATDLLRFAAVRAERAIGPAELLKVLNLIGLVVNGAVILAAGHTQKYLARAGRFVRLQHYFLSAVFAGLAFRLALASRS
jgi:threonine/homoserine/homoserine lactone efflux protein